MPRSAKMNCQSFAVTAVGIAHGMSTAARTRARPRNSRFMISAMIMPRIVSRATVTTVKNKVMRTDGQKSVASTPGGQVLTTPEGDMQRLVSQYR